VSVFRPAVRVTGPDRAEWEIYAYRVGLPRRRRGVRAVVAALWELPRSIRRALASDEWTIEAVTWHPHRTSYRWRTTREFRGHVLAQIQGQLARGEAPRPRHATYLGVSG
jgi:hypothetical protein